MLFSHYYFIWEFADLPSITVCLKVLIFLKQLVAGGGVALIGVTLIPLLSGLLG